MHYQTLIYYAGQPFLHDNIHKFWSLKFYLKSHKNLHLESTLASYLKKKLLSWLPFFWYWMYEHKHKHWLRNADFYIQWKTGQFWKETTSATSDWIIAVCRKQHKTPYRVKMSCSDLCWFLTTDIPFQRHCVYRCVLIIIVSNYYTSYNYNYTIFF